MIHFDDYADCAVAQAMTSNALSGHLPVRAALSRLLFNTNNLEGVIYQRSAIASVQISQTRWQFP
jgi:hypothetical protein